MEGYKTVLGMEIHAELKTASKMFCGCKNDPFHAEKPNMYTCPVCLGLPGALPVPNKKAIEYTIKLGLALGCTINRMSKFDRKHYFYPDLPKGYQLSQYDLPFCYDGVVHTSFGDVRIRRVHLEEDTGKLVHDTVNSEKVTLIDFNRGGVPLIEIVTEPDIHSAAQAKEYAKKIRQIIRYLGISECDMEQGGMRLEANISVQKPGQTDLPNYKVELKNINSFRFLERATEYDIGRQIEILEKGETPVQETRGYNAQKDQTFSQRVKESAEDYRYFPDPDIPPIEIDDAWFKAIELGIPELPDAVFSRWQREYGINPGFAEVVFERPEDIGLWDAEFAKQKQAGLAVDKLVSFMANKLAGQDIKDAQRIVPAFLEATHKDEIDPKELHDTIRAVLAEQPKAVAEFKAGKQQAVQFLVGQTLKKLGKKIDVAKLADTIRQALANT